MILRRLLGFLTALATLAADRGIKHWLLVDFDIDARQPFHVLPFVDLILAWNHGVSYSLFTTTTGLGQRILLTVTLLATMALGVWLWRCRLTTTAIALGLLIGGALGNAVDRSIYGAVMDFVWIHAGQFSWYIFNGADVAITAAVVLLIAESLLGAGPVRATKMP